MKQSLPHNYSIALHFLKHLILCFCLWSDVVNSEYVEKWCSCVSQLLCRLSGWTLSVCPRERWGCPAPLREGTVLSTAGLWMDSHWQTLSSSLQIQRTTASLWNKTSQDCWSALSAITSVMSGKKWRYLRVVRHNITRNQLDNWWFYWTLVTADLFVCP